MPLYLMRHGQASQETINGERPLTETGKQDTKEIAKLLKEKHVVPDRVWHSTKLRAIQTADIVCDALNIARAKEKKDKMCPDDSVRTMHEEIERWFQNGAGKSLMLVGHLPFLGYLSGLFLKGSTAYSVDFSTSSVLALDCDGEGKWKALWQVAP